MAERHRSAVGIDLRRIEPEIARHRHRLDRERLVRLDHVHVGGLETRFLEDTLQGGERSEAPPLRLPPRTRVRPDAPDNPRLPLPPPRALHPPHPPPILSASAC